MSQTKAQLLDPQGDFTLTGQLIGVGATFSGNVSIAGTLTKQDVTNVDSVGLITARSGIDVSGGSAIHAATFDSNNADGVLINLQRSGTNKGFLGSGKNIAASTGGVDDIGLRSNANLIFTSGGGSERLRITSQGSVGNNSTSPVGTLDVTTTAGTGSTVFIYAANHNTSVASQAELRFGFAHSGSPEGIGYIKLKENGTNAFDGNLTFGVPTNNGSGGSVTNDVLTIRGSNQNVGIGTAVPTASLDVESNAASGPVAEFRSVNASNSSRILIDSPADNNLRPSAIVLANAGTDKWGIGQVYGSSSSKAFHICSGSASEDNSKLTITTSGLVGIATAAPADAWLDIASTAGTEAIRMRRLSSDVNVASNWAFKAYGKNLYFREGASSPYDRVHFTDTGNVVATGTVSDSKGNLRSIPKVVISSAHTLAASDAGKTLLMQTGGVTVANSVMSAGDAVTIINASGSDQTITQGSGVTIYNTADASTGNRTLAGRGMCTLWFTDATQAYISGSGLS